MPHERGGGAAHLHTVALVLDRRPALRLCRRRAHQHDAGALGPTGDVAWGTLGVLLHLGCGHASSS